MRFSFARVIWKSFSGITVCKNTVCSRKYSQSVMDGVLPFNFLNYDVIGFDLDHTICMYNLENIIKLQYRLLVDYLVEKGYSPDSFSQDFDRGDVDFIQRGLFLDFTKGNIIKLGEDGTIIRAAHGTRTLSEDEISKLYGIEKKWEPTTMFAKDILSVWEPPWSDIMRSMMDFTDAQVPLVFAQVIDSIDKLEPDTVSYCVWPTILDGIVDMFKPGGSYYVAIYNNPHLYLRCCRPYISEWLYSLRKNKKCLFLLTGARETEANYLASYSLGSNWKEFFDYIIYDAKKPGFFMKNRPFLEEKVSTNISMSPLELTQGNWNELQSLIASKMSVNYPKSVYIGDNLLQDVYVTSFASNIDSIAMVEEMSTDDHISGIFDQHPNSAYLKSHKWQSYIFSPNSSYTVWGSIIRKYSKLCIPSLEYVASKPLDHSFIPFWLETCKL